MAITPLPTPVPQRSDPSNFPARADAFLTALPTFGTEANALQVDVNNKQSLAASSQAAALQSENNAASSAAAAANTANTSVWVSGATIAQYANVISPVDARTYRRRTATGFGTVDPSVDTTNYQIISVGPFPYLKASHRLATGSGGGSSVSGYNTRVLNTLESNNISGASLNSNQITLVAGTYSVRARAPANNAGAHQLFLYNVTDSTTALSGGNETISGNNSVQTSATVEGQFTINATKTFILRHWFTTTQTVTGLGQSVSATGQVEVYTEITIKRLN